MEKEVKKIQVNKAAGRELILPKLQEDNKIQKKEDQPVSVFQAYSYFRRRIGNPSGFQDLLLDCKIVPKPAWNKIWEIELSISRKFFSLGEEAVGISFTGYVACHRRGDFTTYSVRVGDRELWFDSFRRAAICSLNFELVLPSFNQRRAALQV